MTAQRGTYVTPTAGGVGTTAQQARLSQAGLLTRDGDLGIRPGVLSGLTVTGTAGWYYNVSAGHAATTRGATDGAALPTVDGVTATPTVAAAPASGSRFDLVWIRQNDLDAGDADNDAVLGVTQGDASGSPARPYGLVPADALVLYEAELHAGAANTADPLVTITDVRTFTTTRGAPIPVTSLAQRNALPAIPGLEAKRMDLAGCPVERYDGASWRSEPVARFQGSMGAGVTVVGAANIPFTPTEDTAAGWNASTNAWTAPTAGTFLLIGSMKNNSTAVAMSIKFLKNTAPVFVSPTSPSIAYGGIGASFYVRVAAGDTLSMQSTVGYVTHTDAPAVDNFFQIAQIQS